nr:MAG TPA: hypothetical protein [Caudoviricetes sp.]
MGSSSLILLIFILSNKYKVIITSLGRISSQTILCYILFCYLSRQLS